MRVFLLFFVFTHSLHGMDPLQKQETFFIPNIYQIQCISDHVIFVQDFPKSSKQKVCTHDLKSTKISVLVEKKNGFAYLFPSADVHQTKCVFQIIDKEGRHCFEVYDGSQKDSIRIEKSFTAFPCSAWWDDQQKDVVLFCSAGSRGAFRQSATECLQDDRLTAFHDATKGTVFDYNPKDDMILSYCWDKGGYYYGRTSDFNLEAVFLQRAPYSCYLTQAVVKRPLMIRFCKCEDRRNDCVTIISVLNMDKNTCETIENTEPIISADIDGNILVTLSFSGNLRFFDVNRKKCVWGPRPFAEKDVNFSMKQRELLSKLLSLSADARSCVIALSNKLVAMPVPFKVLYDIDEKHLMSIIFSLKNYSIAIPKDILWFLVFKITSLRGD